MKKAIAIIIILIIAAGVGFYFGWVRVEPETFALAHSTITGTFNFPLESGNLYWFWQKLIPKTFHIYTVQKEPYTLEFETRTSLPKSENLADFGTFTLGMKVKIQYRIDFESAKQLFDEGLFSVFHDHYKDEVLSLTSEAASRFVVEGMTRYAYSVRTFDYRILDSLKQELEEKINVHSGAYKLKEVSVSIVYSEIPQLDVYVEALKKYFSHLENVFDLKELELKEKSEYRKRQVAEDSEIARLKKYGELFSEYPVLLKYLYIQKFGEHAEVLVLPQDEKTGFPMMLEPHEKIIEKYFIPESEIPKIEQGARGEIPEEKAEAAPEEVEPEVPEEMPEKPKWYEYLKFWNFVK